MKKEIDLAKMDEAIATSYKKFLKELTTKHAAERKAAGLADVAEERGVEELQGSFCKYWPIVRPVLNSLIRGLGFVNPLLAAKCKSVMFGINTVMYPTLCSSE